MRSWSHAKLLRLDAVGALLSAVALGAVLPRWPGLVGMPTRVLWALSAMAWVMSVHSWWSARRAAAGLPHRLRIVAALNAGYCALTLGLVVWHAASLAWLGYAYFLGEAAIILVLASIEWGQA